MKKRFIDRETWKHKSFRDMKGWAQLLHIHMYLELADFAGIAELDLYLASYNIKMMGLMPEDMDEIAKGIESQWARVGENLFIKKNFLDETQAGRLVLSNPSHVYVFKDMHERWKAGLRDVVQVVLEHNPSTRFQSVKEAEREVALIEERIRATGDMNKINGAKARRKSLDDARRYQDVLLVGDSNLPILANAEEEQKDEKPKTNAADF